MGATGIAQKSSAHVGQLALFKVVEGGKSPNAGIMPSKRLLNKGVRRNGSHLGKSSGKKAFRQKTIDESILASREAERKANLQRLRNVFDDKLNSTLREDLKGWYCTKCRNDTYYQRIDDRIITIGVLAEENPMPKCPSCGNCLVGVYPTDPPVY